MAIQTATAGQLANAQNIVIEQARYTMEHNMPTIGLFERFTLPKGVKSITVPYKTGQMEAVDLTDGVDLTDTEDIGMLTTSLTASEVGLKTYLTYQLLQQLNENAYRIVGRQMGNAMARKMDTDGIALFSGLSNGLGADNKTLSFANLAGCIANAKAGVATAKIGNEPFAPPIFVVHHPNAVYDVMKSLVVTPSATYGVPSGPTNENLKRFYKWSFNDVDVYEDGNIAKDGANDSGYGAIFSKSAFAYVEQKGFTTENDKDISMRAFEVVTTASYGVFELDDNQGASMLYEIGAHSTSA